MTTYMMDRKASINLLKLMRSEGVSVMYIHDVQRSLVLIRAEHYGVRG